MLHKLSICSGHLSAYAVGDGIAVLHQPSATLQAIEGLGCWLFLGLDQGLSGQQLQTEYQQAYPHNPITATQWATLLESLSPLWDTQTGQTAYAEEYAPILRAQPVWQQTGVSFQLQGLGFQIIADNPVLLDAIRALALGDALPNEGDIPLRCQFEISQNANRHQTTYQIACNGQVLARSVTFTGLLPLLMDYSQIMAYQSQNYLLAIHAAAVVKNGIALMLPGVSGSGKSTLCVSLVEQGFECYSDELAILSYPQGRLQPLPLPMAVKTGSWSLLETSWPILKQAIIWERPDGRQLKYIPLPDHARPHAFSAIHQQYVIFPHYTASITAATLQPVSPLHLLQQLATAGYQIKDTVDIAKAEHLIRFAQQTPAYTLHYADLEQAYHCIQALIEHPPNHHLPPG